ncbi:MAG: class I SAM-dependent methyltransferase [bacterium]|nr:class I SAM-dependent methyltransferase [Gammaproteobacteria bacterium]HIL94958.1 class I SAM-dependent methyltransferase [Pseudomonadales bacterium]
MADLVTQRKWDKAAPTFDIMASKGAEERWLPAKRELFSNMDGKILFLALGTGLDIAAFPPGKEITAIDISPKMLEVAEPRIAAYDGSITAQAMDVHEMDFEDESFDQVFTSCTFCSVPNPVEGLKALKRVLKPDGNLFMFEHTGSRYYPFKLMMTLMTQISRRLGPEMNRATVNNVEAAGLNVTEVNNLFMDVVKTIKATK